MQMCNHFGSLAILYHLQRVLSSHASSVLPFIATLMQFAVIAWFVGFVTGC